MKNKVWRQVKAWLGMSHVRLAGVRLQVYRQRIGARAGYLKLKADLADLASVVIDIVLFALAAFVVLWWLYWTSVNAIEGTALLYYTLKKGGLLAIGCYLAIRLEWWLACIVDDCRQMARGTNDGRMPSRRRCVLTRLLITAGGVMTSMLLLLF